MIGPSWELAGWLIAFQTLQAIAAGAVIALLLWYAKRAGARRKRLRGGQG